MLLSWFGGAGKRLRRWSSGAHARGAHNVADQVFALGRHQMDSRDALDRAYALDGFNTNPHAFRFRIGGLLQAPDQFVRNMHAGNVRAHPARSLGRAHRADAYQNEALPIWAIVAYLR